MVVGLSRERLLCFIFTLLTFSVSCSAIGGCIYSPNYPSNYGADSDCEYESQGDGSLTVITFNVEEIMITSPSIVVNILDELVRNA